MRTTILASAFLSLAFLGAGCWEASGIDRKVGFETPNVKDDFCGVNLDYRYCKCAFHDEFCKDIGMSRKEADAHVKKEFAAWVEGKLKTFGAACSAAGGAFNEGRKECVYCQEGFRAANGGCSADEGADDDAYVPDGPLDEDCALIREEYDRDWRKYSDIDEAIPFEERSYEAKQAVTAYDGMIDKMIIAFQLERDIEIENAMQAELETYKEALVNNIKANLLKSFWRLAWVTYSTIDSARGTGGSFATMLTEGASIETLGAGLKVVQANIPADSALAIDTSTLSGKARSVGASTALEAIDSLGDPVKIATEFLKGATTAAMPSADITEEEVEILKQQHLRNGAVDAALSASRAKVAGMSAELATLEQAIAAAQTDIAAWEGKEKDRVASALVESCKTLSGAE